MSSRDRRARSHPLLWVERRNLLHTDPATGVIHELKDSNAREAAFLNAADACAKSSAPVRKELTENALHSLDPEPAAEFRLFLLMERFSKSRVLAWTLSQYLVSARKSEDRSSSVPEGFRRIFKMSREPRDALLLFPWFERKVAIYCTPIKRTSLS